MLDACFPSAVLQKFAAFSRSLRARCISSHSWPVGCFLGAAPPVPPSYARTPVTFPGSSRMQGFSKKQEKLSICRADRLRLGIYALRDQHSTQNFESWRLRVGSWVLTCTLLSKLPPTADAVGMWQFMPSARLVYLAGKMLSVPLLFYYPERFSCLFVNLLKWIQLLRYLERQGKWGARVRIVAFSTWGSGCWEGRARVRIVAFSTWGSGCREGRPVSFKILAWKIYPCFWGM